MTVCKKNKSNNNGKNNKRMLWLFQDQAKGRT